MKIDKETQERIQDLQSGEQNLQNLLLQKQAFQIELGESESALEEVKKAGDEVYKIAGNIMIKASKDQVIRDLDEKIKVFGLRLKAIENQEKIFVEKTGKLRLELEKKFSDVKE